jgi:limonene-1,2-epoxide hydrolase
VLGDDEALDLHFQPLARAADEDALFLERLDDLQDAADVVDRRVAMCASAPRRPSCRCRRA